MAREPDRILAILPGFPVAGALVVGVALIGLALSVYFQLWSQFSDVGVIGLGAGLLFVFSSVLLWPTQLKSQQILTRKELVSPPSRLEFLMS